MNVSRSTRRRVSLPIVFVYVFLAAMALSVPVPAFSQAATPAPPPPEEPSLRTFFPDLVDDVRRLPSNPAGVSVAIGGILSTSLSSFDESLSQWEPQGVFQGGTWMNAPVLAAGTLATYAVGHWADKPRVRHMAVDVLRAQVLSLGLTYGLKYTVRRERPDHSSKDSFPSGHAAQTFASATVLARHLGPQATWPALVAASFVALSRVNQHRHFMSDVVFGAGIGIAVGWNTEHRAGNWKVAPAVSESGVAIHVSRVFSP